MAGSYNVLDIYDPSKEYLDIYIFFQKMFYLKQKYEIVKYRLFILVHGNDALIHFILFYFLGNGIAQLRYLNYMNIQRKDVSPL